MGSRIEELQRPEAAARHEVNELRGEITRLSARLAGRGRPGLFTLPRRDGQDASHPPPEGGRRALTRLCAA